MNPVARLAEAVRRRRIASLAHDALQAPPPSAFRRFGARSVLVPPVRVYGPEHMEIGEDVVLMEMGFMSAYAGPSGTPPRLVIGDRTNISHSFLIAAVGEVVIGPDVLFAARVFVGDASHAFEDVDRPIRVQGMQEGQGVRIGAGSYLGTNCLVLPGARIGAGVVVGAGSVVNGEVPDHVVVVGNPARVVRRWVEGDGWVKVGRDEAGS